MQLVCAFPHQRSSGRGVASMAPQYHCCQSKIPFPMRTNNRQLLEKHITLARKGISLSPRFVNLTSYGEYLTASLLMWAS